MQSIDTSSMRRGKPNPTAPSARAYRLTTMMFPAALVVTLGCCAWSINFGRDSYENKGQAACLDCNRQKQMADDILFAQKSGRLRNADDKANTMGTTVKL